MADMRRQIVINAEKDPNYCPYCMRCPGLVRMQKIEPMYWTCSCGAVHDERPATQQRRVIVSHNSRQVPGMIADPQPAGLAYYEVTVITRAFGMICVHKDNIEQDPEDPRGSSTKEEDHGEC